MIKLHNVNCLVAMRSMPENSIPTIITDPPYGLEFMGKEWDHGVPGKVFWEEALRVAKPGATLMAFGGTRTYHRLACAIEDAGWILRDCVFWAHGQGFPKGQNISKAIDKAAGAKREVIGAHLAPCTDSGTGRYGWNMKGSGKTQANITAPATDLAQLWDGWNTALKPAVEPIVLAMKPLDGTFAQNAEKWGVAGLWIDGGRIGPGHNGGFGREGEASANRRYHEVGGTNMAATPGPRGGSQNGRWPANLIHDGSPEVLACFPDSKGQLATASTSDTQRAGQNCYGNMRRGPNGQEPRGDSGSAARFFYCAKASKPQRNLGCDHLYWRKEGKSFVPISQSEWEFLPKSKRRQGNIHPTVKPVSLLRYLCRLTRTPTGGTVLDPFMGSGSMGVAAIEEGRDFIGMDSDVTAYITAEARTSYALAKEN